MIRMLLLAALFAGAAGSTDDIALAQRGWTWEDIGQAKAIAKKAGVKYDRIVELRDAGLAWSQISEGHGFKLAEVSDKAQEEAKKSREKNAAKVKRSAPTLAVGQGAGYEASQSTGSNH